MSESDGHFPKLVKEIEKSPRTWFPALLQIVIRLSVEKDVFKNISTYCERVIATYNGKEPVPLEEIESIVNAVFEPVPPAMKSAPPIPPPPLVADETDIEELKKRSAHPELLDGLVMAWPAPAEPDECGPAPAWPSEMLNQACSKCGHIRPIAPNNNGICYECLRVDKKVKMTKGWNDDDAE